MVQLSLKAINQIIVAGTYAALLFRYLDANAINTEDTKLIKALDKLTDKWLQVRKSL